MSSNIIIILWGKKTTTKTNKHKATNKNKKKENIQIAKKLSFLQGQNLSEWKLQFFFIVK